MYEMLNIRLQIQQNFNYIIAEINKTAQNNKVIEANKKEETVREKLKKYTKTCKYVDQCKYMSSKTCWFLHEQTRIEKESNSKIELSEEEEWKILFTWANFSGETETLKTSDSKENVCDFDRSTPSKLELKMTKEVASDRFEDNIEQPDFNVTNKSSKSECRRKLVFNSPKKKYKSIKTAKSSKSNLKDDLKLVDNVSPKDVNNDEKPVASVKPKMYLLDQLDPKMCLVVQVERKEINQCLL